MYCNTCKMWSYKKDPCHHLAPDMQKLMETLEAKRATWREAARKCKYNSRKIKTNLTRSFFVDTERRHPMTEQQRSAKNEKLKSLRSYTCVLCAGKGPCRNTLECRRFQKGLLLKDGALEYPTKLQCTMEHTNPAPGCSGAAYDYRCNLRQHQRIKEGLQRCKLCEVWRYPEVECSHPYRQSNC